MEHNTYRDLDEGAVVLPGDGHVWQGFWHRVGYFFSGLFFLKYLKQSLFVMLLGLVYVGNRHYVAGVIRSIEREKIARDGVYAEYMEWEMRYIRLTKRSQIAKRAAAMGLEESKVPPQVIVAQD